MKTNLVVGLILVVAVALGVGCSGTSDETDDVVADLTCGCEADAACTVLDPACKEPVSCSTDADCDDGNACTTGECLGDTCLFTYVGGEGCCETDDECDDGDECTQAMCIEGQCTYIMPDPLCCATDADCDDLDVCTADACLAGQCTHTKLDNCCTDNLECNDAKTCTSDLCIYGKCVHPVDSSVAGCACSSTADCEDMNECTLDKCINNMCEYANYLAAGQPVEGCCEDDFDCDDQDVTTVDVCIQMLCVNYHEKACKFDAECEDGDPCTDDTCIEGYCAVASEGIGGCCITDADCEGGNECTVVTCVDNVCKYLGNVGQAGCCQSNEECNDNIDCTKDVCINHKCDWMPQEEGCCHDPSDCPEATLPCTQAACVKGSCAIENSVNCCDEHWQCDDADPCTDDKCEAKQCFHWDIQGCCATDADCDDENLCTNDVCDAGKCKEPTFIPGCCLDQGQCNDSDVCTIDKCNIPEGALKGNCQYEEKPDCCHNDNECIHEIDCMVPHCVNGNCLFDMGPGCCEMAEDCNDEDDTCTQDLCVDNHCEYKVLPNDEVECCLTVEDCDQSAPCMIPTCSDAHQCEYEEVPDCCNIDDECDDGDDFCTDDLCVGNLCVYSTTGEDGCCVVPEDCDTPDICQAPTCNEEHQCGLEDIEGCCHENTDCDDGDDLCTDDACVENWCVHTPTGAEGCCEKDADCVSEDPCLEGVCNMDTTSCNYEPIEGCCHDETECDDGDDKCTDDTCVDNECVFTFNGTDGCCVEFTFEKNFDDGTDQGWTFDNAMGMGIGIPGFDLSLGWQVAGECGFNSTPSALYYGMSSGMFGSCVYNIDLGIPLPLPNSGTATSQSFELPPGQTYTLDFAVQADVAAGAAADKLTLEVVVGNSGTVVWTKDDLPNVGPSWHEVSIDLSDFAGDTAKLRFGFDTMGGTGSGGVGVMVDDVQLAADCNP